ncbi:MAG: transcriptional regulator [Herbaspirillum sp.]|nr:transcriptional regulator [Herbaspirillum sp.]
MQGRYVPDGTHNEQPFYDKFVIHTSAKHLYSPQAQYFSTAMTARKLPSLNALRAFEVSARHQSFTLAAEELNVTQGAVSHQVKALEEELGVKLFERLHNRLRLTESGLVYLETISDAFDRIESGTMDLHRQRDNQSLVISTSPNFAAKWLVPRLGQFSARYPEPQLRLDLEQHRVNFISEEIDLAIRYGDGPWAGLHCIRLGREFLLPVCSPLLGRMTTAIELAQQTLLHVHDRRTWADWFEARGLPRALAERGIVFNQESAAVDAAANAQGIALARASLAVNDLMQDRLLIPLPHLLPLAQSYWLVYPELHHATPGVVAFRHWLLEAFEADQLFWQKQPGIMWPQMA